MSERRSGVSSAAAAIQEPTCEQVLYYARWGETDAPDERAARQAAFAEALRDLAAHLERLSGQPLELPLAPEAPDPYLSQPLANSGWIAFPASRRACWVRARTYADAYRLHVRYVQPGSHAPDVFRRLREEALWTPPPSPELWGQVVCFAGMARPEDGHALAAQALRSQAAPRQGLGELLHGPLGAPPGLGAPRGRPLGQARIYRGSALPAYRVLLYTHEGAERAAPILLDAWLPQWEQHLLRAGRMLDWLEGVAGAVDELGRLLRGQGRPDLVSREPGRALELYRDYAGRLDACLWRGAAITHELENLDALAEQAQIGAPDTYFSALLRGLRQRADKVAARLAGWQRLRDESRHILVALGAPLGASAAPATRAKPAAWGGPRPEHAAAALDWARETPGWPGRGWVAARAVFAPDAGDAGPRWAKRGYDELRLTISGPATALGYPIACSAPAIGDHNGWFTPPAGAEPAALFEALWAGGDAGFYRAALALARAAGRGLRWRVQLVGAPELEALPWEALLDPEEGWPIAASAETPLARVIETPHPVAPWVLDLPLRVLVAVASPADAASRFELPAAASDGSWLAEQARAAQAANSECAWRVEEHASAASIYQALVEFRPHLLAIAAHGLLRHDAEHLLLEADSGNGRLANARSLAALWREQPPQMIALLPLAANSAPALNGLARRLSRALACAALSWPRAAETGAAEPGAAEPGALARLCDEWIRVLAAGNPPDVALAEARRRLRLAEARLELSGADWGAPILYAPRSGGAAEEEA